MKSLSNFNHVSPDVPEEKKRADLSVLTMAQVEEILSHCYPGMSDTILTPKEAKERAEAAYEDMKSVGFPLRIGTSWPVKLKDCEVMIPSYLLEGSMYGPEADPYGEHNRDAAGPLINCGEFVRLSKACKLGRSLLERGDWPQKFASKLRDPQQHLSTIEEVLWLGRWYAPSKIEMAYKQNLSSGKDIDWRFICCGQKINLEVKYRLRDWLGLVDGPYFSRNFDSYFKDLEGKFGQRPDDELNIVAITTFTPPDRGLRECTGRFLERHLGIDAVIFWSIHDPKGERPEIHAKKPDLIKVLIKGPDREDDLLASPIRHLWRNSKERRAMRPEEAIEAISKLGFDGVSH